MGRLFENHDESLYYWRRIGTRAKTVLHLDSHHDLHPAIGPGRENIANYLSYAILEGIASRVVWVVPDVYFLEPRGRLRLAGLLADLMASQAAALFGVRDSVLSLRLLGAPVLIYPLARIPALTPDETLLDIDVDYLLQDCLGSRTSSALNCKPWIWPEEIVRKVRALGLGDVPTTISFSVQGGYTPLEWRYLGHELSLRLGCSERFEGVLAFLREQPLNSETEIPPSTSTAPCWLKAAVRYARAVAFWRARHWRLARREFRVAAATDSAYTDVWGSKGIFYAHFGRHVVAKREFRMHATFNPHDARTWVLLGEACLALGQDGQALKYARKALAMDPNLPLTHRLLGDLSYRSRDFQCARAYMERSLSLQIVRQASRWTDPYLQNPAGIDSGHFATYTRVGCVYSRLGQRARAAQAFRIRLAVAPDDVMARWHLAAASPSMSHVSALLGCVFRRARRHLGRSITRCRLVLALAMDMLHPPPRGAESCPRQ